jgi:hypothetical protein
MKVGFGSAAVQRISPLGPISGLKRPFSSVTTGPQYRMISQANRVKKSCCDKAGEEFIVPSSDLASDAE